MDIMNIKVAGILVINFGRIGHLLFFSPSFLTLRRGSPDVEKDDFE